MQAAVEGVPLPAGDGKVTGDGYKVDFMGAKFQMAERIGLWPLIEFSMAQKRGLDSQDGSGLAALGEMILGCLDESEHNRFGRHATDTKAEADDFMKMIQTCIETLTARPMTRPGDSSAGPRTTSANLRESSSLPATRRPEILEGMVSPADLDRST